MNPRILIGIAAAFGVAAILGVLHYTTDSYTLQFVVGIVALAGLAWSVGVGTESVGARFGPSVTGVLQSTLGNLPELFIVIFALARARSRRADVDPRLAARERALVLGLAIMAGAWRSEDGIMRFAKRLPNDTATLLSSSSSSSPCSRLGAASRTRPRTTRSRSPSSGRCCCSASTACGSSRTSARAAARSAALEHEPPLPFGRGSPCSRLGRRGRFVSEWFVASSTRRSRPRDLEGVHRARHRRDRRQRGREHRRDPACAEAPSGSRDLGREELGRADRGLPLPGARSHLARLRPALDLLVRRSSSWSRSPLRRSRSGRSPATARPRSTRASRSSRSTSSSRPSYWFE